MGSIILHPGRFDGRKGLVITVIGSLRFISKMQEIKRKGIAYGYKIYIPEIGIENPDKRIREAIDKSNMVFVCNDLDGGVPYIGEATASEIQYAKDKGKDIQYYIPLSK